jgi:hypothetical protein
MPFGFVTRRQLDQQREDLRKEIAATGAAIEEIQYEWAKWYNKFRSLYAMLLKREKKADGDAEQPPTPGEGEGEIVQPGASSSDVLERRRHLRGW